ncbi:MAG: DUF4197 domain-containing protein [Bacteroidetes bacterium HGW-Bacteroidetes-6]|jgi:hypothetical protein|nr:MAG: DUF4197 domain-containing protein [Bacteroidetes bacterium HGW-Bacteroidetes-6]
MRKTIFASIAVLLLFAGCDTISKMNLPTGGAVILSESDIVSGLKEALNVGTNNAVGLLGKADGFLKNPLFKIPFPEDAKRAETKLRELGMNDLVDNFITTMNHGAENAVSKAAPIFLNAITSMTFEDAKNILKGADNAATEYFKAKTTTALFGLFKPEIQKALDAVNATKYWTDITSTYNKIPFVTKIETDLAKYVTDKALSALFTQIASEEKKIRTDPVARVNDILKKVFNPNAVIQ